MPQSAKRFAVDRDLSHVSDIAQIDPQMRAILEPTVGALTALVYVPVPEKNFTPTSELSLQDASLSSLMEGGAPRSGWKFTVHGPSIVASSVWITAGIV
jgi:hypothetical protein